MSNTKISVTVLTWDQDGILRFASFDTEGRAHDFIECSNKIYGDRTFSFQTMDIKELSKFLAKIHAAK